LVLSGIALQLGIFNRPSDDTIKQTDGIFIAFDNFHATTSHEMFQIWSDSSIHGVRYISSSKTNLIIRLFWLLSFTLSIIGFFYYGREAYLKYSVKPDINLIIKLKPIRDIPFPAVTICSPEPATNNFDSTDIHMEDLEQFLMDDEEYLSNKELSYLAAMGQACNSNYLSNLFQNRPDIFQHMKERNFSNDIVRILNEISFPTKVSGESV
jgi:hypothetical protein